MDKDDESKGYTVTYLRYDDGKPVVTGRFKTKAEKDKFLSDIYKDDSGWMEDELSSISVINDYDYILPY